MPTPSAGLDRGDVVRYVGDEMEFLKPGDLGLVLNVSDHDVFVRFELSGVGAFDESQVQLVEPL